MDWQAISVISFIFITFLGWLVKLTAEITTLKNKVSHLELENQTQNKSIKEFLNEFREFKERFIRLEERIESFLANFLKKNLKGGV